MDLLTHGLWPYAATVKRKNWRWWALVWGMFPDIGTLPQIVYLTSLGKPAAFVQAVDWEHLFIPDSWMLSYRITHSLMTLLVILGLYWLVRRRIAWPLAIGWGSHLLLDLFTHVGVYAAEPFFPLSRFAVSGISWGDPRIFFPNWIALAVVFAWLGIRRFRRRRLASQTG